MDERFEVFATEKGQIVIPAALRQRYGIKKGTKILIFDFNGQLVFAPQTLPHLKKVLERLRGSHRGSGSMKAFMEERAWERAKEEKDLEEWKAKKTTRV